MTALNPREPYSREELERLYPKPLKLHLVQILLRHGERTPVSARFQNAGLAPYWPYCASAKQLKSVALTSTNPSSWSTMEWRRRLETFDSNDAAALASGPDGSVDGVCNPGELTDKGRSTTLALGQRLRHLYVDQLRYLPPIISDPDILYLRSTHMPRALESVQQAFWGLYPLTARTASFPPPNILTRAPQDETLYPNEPSCRRLDQLSRAFADRCAEHWNSTPEMSYLTAKLSRWMPDNRPVRVDSHPRLSGIMDTINSTLAHGPKTRLPSEFYDPRVRTIIEQIGIEEWFAGYAENNEYRTLGIGSLAGDIVARMIDSVERSGQDGTLGGGEKGLKMGLSGCHDTTLAPLLTSLGVFEGEKWPSFTSHVAFELLRDMSEGRDWEVDVLKGKPDRPATASRSREQNESQMGTNLLNFLGFVGGKRKIASEGFGRKPFTAFAPEEQRKLEDYYVRVRYDDRVMTLPACKEKGKHWRDDESLCTLEAFKRIVDGFTPTNWKEECTRNLDKPPMKEKLEPAGLMS